MIRAFHNTPTRFLAFVFACSMHAEPAQAGWGSYLSGYRATAELKAGAASSTLRYDAPRLTPMPDRCVEHVSDASLMACSNQIGGSSKPSYTIGIEQAFKRQGNYYFGADFGASIFLLSAKADEKEEKVLVLQPLQHARVHLYGLNVRAYLQFGITPAKIWPDFLVSVGVGQHLSAGKLKVEDLGEDLSIATGLGYVQVEAVWWRFKDGSLSSYLMTESGGSHSLKEDYGVYQNMRLNPALVSVGILKLVLPYKTQ